MSIHFDIGAPSTWESIADKPTGLVVDSAYVHTDHNYSDAEKSKTALAPVLWKLNVLRDAEAATVPHGVFTAAFSLLYRALDAAPASADTLKPGDLIYQESGTFPVYIAICTAVDVVAQNASFTTLLSGSVSFAGASTSLSTTDIPTPTYQNLSKLLASMRGTLNGLLNRHVAVLYYSLDVSDAAIGDSLVGTFDNLTFRNGDPIGTAPSKPPVGVRVGDWVLCQTGAVFIGIVTALGSQCEVTFQLIK